MPIIIVIDKSGSAKQQKILDTNIDNLYKKAGFKSSDGFECRNEWHINIDGKTKYNVHVYGKTDGKAGQENKFDFPPPIDNTLFFGSVVLVNMDKNHMSDLTLDAWNQIYEYLFGGFEDLNDDDEDEMDTDDEIEELEQSISAKRGEQVVIKRTKQGYAKDGFIVDDDEDEETEYTETEDEGDSEEETNDDDSEKESVKIAPMKTRQSKRLAKKVKKELIVEEETEESGYLNCTSELEEEEYV